MEPSPDLPHVMLNADTCAYTESAKHLHSGIRGIDIPMEMVWGYNNEFKRINTSCSLRVHIVRFYVYSTAKVTGFLQNVHNLEHLR